MPATPATPTARPDLPAPGAVRSCQPLVPVPTLLGARGLKGDAQTPRSRRPRSLRHRRMPSFLRPCPFRRIVRRWLHRGLPNWSRSQHLLPHRHRAWLHPLSNRRNRWRKQALTPELLAELARSAGYTPTPPPKPAPRAPMCAGTAGTALAAPHYRNAGIVRHGVQRWFRYAEAFRPAAAARQGRQGGAAASSSAVVRPIPARRC